MPLPPHASCEAVAEVFSSQPELFAQPIVDADGTPVGLLNRFRLLERFSRPFGRDLLLRCPIISCVSGPPVIVDLQTPIDQVGARLYAGEGCHVLDGFIVTRDNCYHGVGTGVTLTRALADQSLARARTTALEAASENQAKSVFVANICHEIRTPLNGVLGLAALLLETPLSDDQRELADLLRISGDALLGLVDDVLDYSKLAAGKLRLETVAFDLRGVVRDTTRILSVRAGAKGLSLRYEVDGTIPELVSGDAKRMRQVLLNLGANAVKFTEQGSVTIRVRGSACGSGVLVAFAIEDTGIGIAPEVAGRLFTPYTQADSSTSRQFGGTGLGLAISQQIVESMGGRIELISSHGRGATFSFTLRFEAADRPEMPATARMRATLPGLRILLAEDNPVNELVTTRFLRKLGCSGRSVANGGAAIAALGDDHYDLVLMDCQMPEMDGFEATARIRSGEAGPTCRRIPIIALTANATVDARAACLAAGMDAFLTKPLTLEALRQGLSPWLVPATSPACAEGARAAS
ncbi:MAG: ATP-binding protein [Vicinamibacterales bacterium]